MEKKDGKKLYGREELKTYFKNGEVPNENHYERLIDSVLIKHDDGFSKDEDSGFIVSPTGESQRLVTFYKSMDRLDPFFMIEKDSASPSSLRFTPGDKTDDAEGHMAFYLQQNGNLNIGKRPDKDLYKLHVSGFVGAAGRIGTHKVGAVKANGIWHNILEELDNCQAFEVMARTGLKGSKRFSILHATALSAFGRSSNKIRKTCAYYGFFWNKLNLRWKKDSTHKYSLQLRSNRNYGDEVFIYYHVGKLWDDELFMPPDYYYLKEEAAKNRVLKKSGEQKEAEKKEAEKKDIKK